MLIDPALAPPVVSIRLQVEGLNAAFERLLARVVDQIVIPEQENGFRASNMIRVYLQAHLRRMLQLTEAAFVEFFDGRGVAAVMCARGLYEGFATLVDFDKEFTELLSKGDVNAIFQFTKERANATKMKDWIEGIRNPKVAAKNVVTMVEKLKSLRSNIPNEYNFLSEIVHPNGVGAVGFFANMNGPEDIAYFTDSGPDPTADLQWIIVAAYFLTYFEVLMNQIEEQLPKLSALGAAQAR